MSCHPAGGGWEGEDRHRAVPFLCLFPAPTHSFLSALGYWGSVAQEWGALPSPQGRVGGWTRVESDIFQPHISRTSWVWEAGRLLLILSPGGSQCRNLPLLLPSRPSVIFQATHAAPQWGGGIPRLPGEPKHSREFRI